MELSRRTAHEGLHPPPPHHPRRQVLDWIGHSHMPISITSLPFYFDAADLGVGSGLGIDLPATVMYTRKPTMLLNGSD